MTDLDEYAVILDQARASIAAGRAPDWAVLAERIRAVAHRPRVEADPEAESAALRQLELLASLQRARARVAPAEPQRQVVVRRPQALRERPGISGNMDVRRDTAGEAFVLRWDAAPSVLGWTVRISERSDPRGAYAVREERELPAGATSTELSFEGNALRVHLLGRGRGGKLVRRAVMSPLTPETWGERWQRRASAA